MCSCSIVNSSSNHNTRAEKIFECKYQQIVRDENVWKNQDPLYSPEALPIDGDSENIKYKAPYWVYPYKESISKNEFDSLLAATRRNPHDYIVKLIREYGASVFIYDMAFNYIKLDEIKKLVYQENCVATEYFLWRHNILLSPIIKIQSPPPWLLEHRVIVYNEAQKMRASLLALKAKGVKPDDLLKTYSEQNYMVAAYLRTFVTWAEYSAEKKMIYAVMDFP